MRLEDRNALVTGAGSGIGQAMAELFAKEGANVAINDIEADRLAETARLVEAEGRKALPLPFDVTDFAAVRDATAHAIEELGHIDVLCANAGIAPTVDFVDMSEDAWDRMIKVHLYGAFYCCKAVVDHMIERGHGRIIITASMSAINGDIHLTHYSAAKAGQVGMARALARELCGTGVTVNVIAPGLTKTNILGEVDDEVIQKYAPPIGRIGQPYDQAYAALYLASEEGSFVTGHTLQVNGGAF